MNVPNDSRNKKVSVVVISYNGERHLEECLSSVLEAEGPLEEVIFVDDGSTDGSVSLVQRKFPRVKIVALRENSGPAAARNAGVECSKARWVCLIDNDIRVDKRWLAELCKASGEKGDGALLASRVGVYETPSLIGTDGLDVHYLGMPTFRNNGAKLAESDDLAVREIGAAGGACILIDKEKVGRRPFDEDFFYGFEDTDLCLRCRIAGDKCYVVPSSVVFHKFSTGGVEGLSDEERRYSSRRAFYVFRNRWWLILKYYEFRSFLALCPALVLFELVCAAFAARRGVVVSYVAAAKALATTWPKIRAKRKAVQNTRVVGDAELFSAFSLSPGSGTVRSGMEAALFEMIDVFFKKYWKLVKRSLNARYETFCQTRTL